MFQNNPQTIIRISESFTLRKIDPTLILAHLLNGKYGNRNLPDKKIRNNHTLVNLGKEVGTNPQSEIYRFKDRNNNNLVIYTTNHLLYKYVQNLDKNLEPPLLKCKYCKRGKLKNPIGLPICMEVDNNSPIFYVIDSFCDFGCCFSYLKRKLGETKLYRNHYLSNAEQLLYCYYYTVYPDKKGTNIKEKPDWELLRENGGPLNDDEFDYEQNEYIPLSSIITLPAKKQFLKLKRS